MFMIKTRANFRAQVVLKNNSLLRKKPLLLAKAGKFD